MSAVIRAMRNHDANEETRFLFEGQRVIAGWTWLWLEWMFGIGIQFDSADRPGAWLSIGPLGVGFYIETATNSAPANAKEAGR